MPVEEFARLYYAMSRVLEDATESLSLSKRSGIALWLLAQTTTGEMETKELVRKFAAWHVAKTQKGASRDVSLANTELDDKGFISIRLNPYRIRLTPEGQRAATQLLDAIRTAVSDVSMLPEQRNLLRALVLGQTPRRSPHREESA